MSTIDSYDHYLERRRHKHCYACGLDERQRPGWWGAPWCLHKAHLAAGSGTMLRLRDERLILPLCPLCHSLHRHWGGVEVVNRIVGELSCLSDANMLWLKQAVEPDLYDPELIARAWKRRPPDSDPPSAYYWERIAARRPGFFRLWEAARERA
jgi:hypothetical protein